MEKYTINAEGKKLGRVATEAAKLLMAKNHPAYAANVVPNVQVEIVNASKADISTEKLQARYHRAYSGFAGGYKETTWEMTVAKKGYGELFKIAIDGMLPKNKLRAKIIKNLTVTE
ncbi:MAG TPA: uL13 family ribosomal protein [Candidatus Paceibacterota bacterium]|nr:uL13 family ribosomal protein [Candidatus Paceibacterota bacterium]